MSINKDLLKEDLESGKSPILVGYEVGFFACMQSVKDKGHNSLYSLLETELTKIKLSNQNLKSK